MGALGHGRAFCGDFLVVTATDAGSPSARGVRADCASRPPGHKPRPASGRSVTAGYDPDVKAVLVDVPAALLRERRRTGADKADEMWDGVLHMVPPPSALHQRVASQLHRLLAPLAEARGPVAFYETDDKIDWYAALGVRELLVVEPVERRVELWGHVEGQPAPVPPDADGSVQSEVLSPAHSGYRPSARRALAGREGRGPRWRLRQGRPSAAITATSYRGIA